MQKAKVKMQSYNSKLKITFFGSSEYVIPIIKVLQKNFDLRLVLTTEKNPTDAVPSYCVKNRISHLYVSNLSDPNLKPLILNLKSDVAVLADFGLIIPKGILNIFPKGIINIHPSLLPKYRGPTPVQTAILNGEKTTGVSIMKLDERIDHGPILSQERERVLNEDTSESLFKRLFEKGSTLLLKILPNYLNGNLNPTPQNHEEATFTKPLTRQDGYLNLSKITRPPATSSIQSDTKQEGVAGEVGQENQKSKIELGRKIRAYFPWPGVWTKLNLKTKDQRPKTIKFLPGNLIQVEGKKPVNYKEFLNGYPEGKELLSKLKLLGNL